MKRPRQLPLWPTARTAPDQLFDGRAVLAVQVRAARLRRHLTQEVLAERAGLDRSYLSGIERSQYNVPIDTVCRLAWALRMEPRDLLSPGDGRRRKAAAGRPRKE